MKLLQLGIRIFLLSRNLLLKLSPYWCHICSFAIIDQGVWHSFTATNLSFICISPQSITFLMLQTALCFVFYSFYNWRYLPVLIKNVIVESQLTCRIWLSHLQSTLSRHFALHCSIHYTSSSNELFDFSKSIFRLIISVSSDLISILTPQVVPILMPSMPHASKFSHQPLIPSHRICF